MTMKFSGAELMANPRGVLDAIAAEMSASAMASFGDGSHLRPDELAAVRDMNRQAGIDGREFARQLIIKQLRALGADIPDDIGALSDQDASLLQAEPGGTA